MPTFHRKPFIRHCRQDPMGSLWNYTKAEDPLPICQFFHDWSVWQKKLIITLHQKQPVWPKWILQCVCQWDPKNSPGHISTPQLLPNDVYHPQSPWHHKCLADRKHRCLSEEWFGETQEFSRRKEPECKKIMIRWKLWSNMGKYGENMHEEREICSR